MTPLLRLGDSHHIRLAIFARRFSRHPPRRLALTTTTTTQHAARSMPTAFPSLEPRWPPAQPTRPPAPPLILNRPLNLIPITSPSHIRALLSADLSRVSLISFWAPWAAPCKAMNEVVLELAKRYAGLLVLTVEADELAEVAQNFEVDEESVRLPFSRPLATFLEY